MILKLGLILLIFPLAALLGGYFSEMSLVNECIRAQGSFDYLKQVCDFQQQQPFIPYLQRHPAWVNTAIIISLVGLMLCFFGLYQRRK